MKNKPYSNKKLLHDNIEMNRQLQQCFAKNVELKIQYERMLNDVDDANKHMEEVASFINDKYPDFWEHYTEWKNDQPKTL